MIVGVSLILLKTSGVLGFLSIFQKGFVNLMDPDLSMHSMIKVLRKNSKCGGTLSWWKYWKKKDENYIGSISLSLMPSIFEDLYIHSF